jgi:putative oxidoreductase
MATTYQKVHPQDHAHLNLASTKSKLLVVPIARVLFSFIFIFSGLNHFSGDSIEYAASHGLPLTDILVPLSGLILLLGGISIALGYHARTGAILLLIFLLPTTFLMHSFWLMQEPQQIQYEMVQFMKNISLMGGALLIAFYGAGPVSLDLRKAKRSPTPQV